MSQDMLNYLCGQLRQSVMYEVTWLFEGQWAGRNLLYPLPPADLTAAIVKPTSAADWLADDVQSVRLTGPQQARRRVLSRIAYCSLSPSFLTLSGPTPSTPSTIHTFNLFICLQTPAVS